jgi:hypothetical protein
MIDGPKVGASNTSEPPTQQLQAQGSGPDQLWERVPTSPMPPPEGFAAVEGPTLSSPSSDPIPLTATAIESRLRTLEHHLEETERELAEVYGAVEHLVRNQETVDRILRQQRHGRYLMWGTLIAILVMLWLTLRSRLGMLGPR